MEDLHQSLIWCRKPKLLRGISTPAITCDTPGFTGPILDCVWLCYLASIAAELYEFRACFFFLHKSLSFSLFLPLSVPLQHVKVLDVVNINLSIFLQSWGGNREMMLFDNVLRNGEKNRVGWGNHQGQRGNGSRVTLQLSISFLPLLSLSLSGSFRHTHPRCLKPTHKNTHYPFFCHCKHHWLSTDVLLGWIW